MVKKLYMWAYTGNQSQSHQLTKKSKLASPFKLRFCAGVLTGSKISVIRCMLEANYDDISIAINHKIFIYIPYNNRAFS